MEQSILRMREQFGAMFAQYDQLAGRIKAAPVADVIDDPVKREWASQEGYRPGYNPNSDSVTWNQKPEPAYLQPHYQNFEGSMSPERLVESFPAFAYKAKHLDPYIQETIDKAMSGEISTQRAKEILYQFALESFEEAWQGGRPTGAAKTATTFAEAVEKASKDNKVAGGDE